MRGSPCGVVAEILSCKIVISKFKLWLCYYIHFQTNTLGKVYYTLSMNINEYVTVLINMLDIIVTGVKIY